jgi:hypothetical protein
MPLPYRPPFPRAVPAAWLLGLALLGGPPVEASPLLTTVSGGLISGAWGGTAFTNATFTVTASYDPALVQPGTLAGFPATFVGVTPTIAIDTGSGLLSGTLEPFAGFTWHLFSLAVTANDSRSGFAPIDPSLNVTNAFDIAAAWPQNTLLEPVAFGGDSAANAPATWQTSLGTLEITNSTDAAGTFVIVPEPSTMAVLGIALIALAARRRFNSA